MELLLLRLVVWLILLLLLLLLNVVRDNIGLAPTLLLMIVDWRPLQSGLVPIELSVVRGRRKQRLLI